MKHSIKTISCLVCISMSTALLGLSPADSLNIVRLGDAALAHLEKGQTALADSTLRMALDQAKAGDDLVLYLNLLKNYATFYKKAEQPDLAISWYSRGRTEALWRPAKSEDEIRGLAWLYVQMSQVYLSDLGHIPLAQRGFDRAVRYFSAIGMEDDYNVAKFAYRYLGGIHTRLGDYRAAEVHLQHALRIFLDQGDFKRAADMEIELGLVYTHWSKPDEAEARYRNALAFPTSHLGARATAYINLADLLVNSGCLDDARRELQSAFALLKEDLASDDPYWRSTYLLAECHRKSAILREEQGALPAAKSSLDTALELFQRHYGSSQRREFGKLYGQIAVVDHKMGDYPSALANYQKALEAILYGYQSASIHQLPPDSLFYAENTILATLQGMAETYLAWYRATGDTRHPRRALACYELTFAAEAALRRSYLYESSQLLSTEDHRRNIEQAIRVALELYAISDDPLYQEKAFVFAERGRSTLLRESFRAAHASELAGITPAQRQEEEQLQQAVSRAEEQLFQLRGEGTPDSLVQAAEQNLLSARQALNDWLSALERDNPRYFQLKYDDEVPSLRQLRQSLQSGQWLAEYFLGADSLYIFVLGPSQLSTLTLPKAPNLNERILRFRQAIENYQYPDQDRGQLTAAYTDGGQSLYQELFAPLARAFPRAGQWLIIPSGVLDLLPFEALLTGPAPAHGDFRAFPYLLHRYEISYGYSATLHHALRQLPRSGKGLGAFAPDFPRGGEWPSLECSQEMLSDIAPGWRDFTDYRGPAATEAAFRELAGRYQLLLLATHAQANPDADNFSFVVFAHPAGGYDSLFTKDLYTLDLPAELVTLSACETALGALYQSEGVISLARGFHYAGARSVLTTQWAINEGANCKIMTDFYGYLAGGYDKSGALRQAKLDFLANHADVRLGHPVYWAGFHLFGNTRPVQSNRSYWLWLAGGGLLLLIGGFSWRQRWRSGTALKGAPNTRQVAA